MTTRIFSSGIRRREDPRLITGRATYTDDIFLPATAHAAILRSPHAHARIKSIDTTKALASDGVVAVYTGADTDGVLEPIPCAWLIPDSDLKAVAHPAIAKDVVRYQGDARGRCGGGGPLPGRGRTSAHRRGLRAAPDGAGPAEGDGRRRAPSFMKTLPTTRPSTGWWTGGDTEAAFNAAEVVVKDRIVHQRLIPNAIEPHSALAQFVKATGELTLWSTSQNPHIARFLSSVVTGLGEHKIMGHRAGGGRRIRQPR